MPFVQRRAREIPRCSVRFLLLDRGSARKQQLAQNNVTPKDQFRYSVLSAIHDEALSISDAIDQAYREHVAGKDAEIERLRARSAKFEQLLSEALRQGWLDESKTSPS